MTDRKPADFEIDAATLERLGATFDRLRDAIGQAFFGQRKVVDLLLAGLLARGHVLLESAPGLGKTTLVKSLASGLGLAFRRIQFTPDLMPADVLGSRVLEEDEGGKRTFRHEPGPIFTQVLLADEINRATPRTQASLLEAMQERQVTLFDGSRALDEGFFVVATQNPIEMEGTYPLPEAQLDRFEAKIQVPAPSRRELVEILRRTTGQASPMPEPCLTCEDLDLARKAAAQVPVASEWLERTARLVLSTDPRSDRSPDPIRSGVRFGSSPRGGQAVLRLAKAHALLHGRAHVAPEDMETVVIPALRHRLVLSYEGEASGVSADDLVRTAFEHSATGD